MTRGYRSWFQDLINIWTVPATILKIEVMYRQFFQSVAFVNYKRRTCLRPLYLYFPDTPRIYMYIYRVSHELRSLLRESVPYVKINRYNPKHLCPKLNGYGDNGQRKVWTSCIYAYCTSSAVSALTLTEQCSRHLCECTSSAQRNKIVLQYCQIFMRYVQCLVTLRTTMT